MGHILDEVDRQIVALLQRDGRISNVDMARELGLTEGTIRKRLERLLASDAICIRAVINPAKLGYPTRIIVGLQVDLAQVEAAALQLAAIPEIDTVSIVTGTYDMVIEVILPSSDLLLSFLLDKVATVPGVKRTETCHILKIVKRAHDWAIPSESPARTDSQPQGSSASGDVIPGSVVVPS